MTGTPKQSIKKNGPNERTDQSSRKKKIQLSDKEIANLSDRLFKTLVIGCSRNQEWWKETRTQIKGLEQKEEITIQPEQNEEARIQKNEERLRNLQDIFKCSNIQIIGVPEGEEEEQQIENFLEQIRKEYFPSLGKEIDFQEVQEAQSPKEAGPNEEHTKAHHNYITQD